MARETNQLMLHRNIITVCSEIINKSLMLSRDPCVTHKYCVGRAQNSLCSSWWHLKYSLDSKQFVFPFYCIIFLMQYSRAYILEQ